MPKHATYQLPIEWGPGHETEDDGWELDETHMQGMIHDSGAITFRVMDESIAWEEDGDIEVLLDDRLAAYIVHAYVSVHGVPTEEDFDARS